MKRIRRNAFAAGKKGDVSPAETLPSPDYSQDGVFDMVPSSHGVDLRSDAEDDESHSPSCLHLTEVQVQGTIIRRGLKGRRPFNTRNKSKEETKMIS